MHTVSYEQRNDSGQGSEAVSGRGSLAKVPAVRGGEGLPISSYRNMPLITREDAWEAVKTFAARGDLHHHQGAQVGRARVPGLPNVDGSPIDANTALAVKL